MIDLHANLLPGTPGGPRSRTEAVTLAREALAAGTTELVVSPPLGGPLAEALGLRDAALARLSDDLAEAGVALETRPGGILDLEQLTRAGDDELRRASLGGNGRWLAVRLPEVGWPLRLPEMIDGLAVRDFGLVLVEPERGDSVQRTPDRLRDPIGRGALVLVGGRSLMGEHGPRVRWTAANLLRAGEVHLLGSGGGATDHPARLDDALGEAATILRRDAEELAWLVDGGPRAVLAGGQVRPPRITQARRPRPDGRRGPGGRPPRSAA